MLDHLLILFLISVVLSAGAADALWGRISNWITLPAMMVGPMLNTALAGLGGLSSSLKGLGLGVILLLGVYAIGAMGAGDVKLLGAIGGIVGPGEVLIIFALASLLGGLYAVVQSVYGFGVAETFRRTKTCLTSYCLAPRLLSSVAARDPVTIRFGIVLAAGTLIAVSRQFLIGGA
jgi:prepilin peptidase CpaA